MSIFLEKYFNHLDKAPVPKVSLSKISSKLNLNEMPMNVPENLVEEIVKNLSAIKVNRYSEPYYSSLIISISEWQKQSPENILVGPGSSSFITLLLDYFGNQVLGDIIILRPSFVLYEHYCKTHKITYKTWDLDNNYQFVPEDLGTIKDYSIIFLTTPNNPTGTVVKKDTLKELLEKHNTSLFVVDEAYAEFAEENMLNLIDDYENVIVLRTMSKAYHAAGLRCGILFSKPGNIDRLRRLMVPWNLSVYTVSAIKDLIEYEQRTHWFEEQINGLRIQREKIYISVKGSKNIITYPSQANFILLKVKDTELFKLLSQRLSENGILVNYPSNLSLLENCLRITVGNKKENRELIKILADFR